MGICTDAAGHILESCEAVLRAFVVGRERSPELIQRLERATFLIGAVAILGFTPNEEEVKPQKAAALAKEKGRGKRKESAAASSSSSSSSAPTIHVPVPSAIICLLRVLLSPELLPVSREAQAQGACALVSHPPY